MKRKAVTETLNNPKKQQKQFSQQIAINNSTHIY